MNKIPEWQGRTALLMGEEAIHKLKKSHVLVVGLGGVGAYAAEMLCRAGIGELTLVDGDKVSQTNRNRQLIALQSTENKFKTDVLEKRLLEINPDIRIHKITDFVKDEKIDDLLDAPYDYVIDAIDTLSPKIFLLFKAFKLGFPVVSSMGSGGKYDPTKIEITDISKSYNCRLAHAIRKQLNRMGVRKGFKVVFSAEDVDPGAVQVVEGEKNKKSNVGTISYMPAAFGICLSSVVIRDLIQNQSTK
jgi:tRNA A37 threonylcarbamoyladenosine dehydratase